jgi:hypothetical protein
VRGGQPYGSSHFSKASLVHLDESCNANELANEEFFSGQQVSPPPVLPAAKFLNETARLAVNEAAQGRDIKYIKLYKPEGSSLGFSVVGLKSAHKGELGIYVQEIQPQGIAGKDGRLLEGDQVKTLPKSSSDETTHIYRIQT